MKMSVAAAAVMTVAVDPQARGPGTWTRESKEPRDPRHTSGSTGHPPSPGPMWSRPLASPTASPAHDSMRATLKTEDLRASGPAVSSCYHCQGG